MHPRHPCTRKANRPTSRWHLPTVDRPPAPATSGAPAAIVAGELELADADDDRAASRDESAVATSFEESAMGPLCCHEHAPPQPAFRPGDQEQRNGHGGVGTSLKSNLRKDGQREREGEREREEREIERERKRARARAAVFPLSRSEFSSSGKKRKRGGKERQTERKKKKLVGCVPVFHPPPFPPPPLFSEFQSVLLSTRASPRERHPPYHSSPVEIDKSLC